MTDAQRLSLAYVEGWNNVPSPRIERWVLEHGRLPTAEDRPLGSRMWKSAEHRAKIGETKRKRLVSQIVRAGKYGTGRREG